MRRLISTDTETELIARGRQVPQIIVLSFAELDLSHAPNLRGTPRIKNKGLISRHEYRPWLVSHLRDPDVHFTGANIAYDVLVTSARWPNPDPDAPTYDEEMLALWVKAYDDNRVTDLLTRQKLLDLAAGCYRREQLSDGRWQAHRYNLGSLAWRLCRMQLDKGNPRKAKKLSTALTVAEQAAAQAASSEVDEQDATEEQENSWRLRYAELKDVPIKQWPEAASKYALDDAVAGALVWWEQESGRLVPSGHPLNVPPIALSGSRYSQRPVQNPTLSQAGHVWAKVRENFGNDADPFVDEHRQARAALWLRAMSAHGLRTDAKVVEKFGEWVETKHAEVNARLVQAGLVRIEWHLDKDKLKEWVTSQCRSMDCSDTGIKKAELLKLADLGKDDPNNEVALAASNWLQIIRTLRTHSANPPDPETLEAAQLAQAWTQFHILQAHSLAYVTYHRSTKAAARAMVEACGRAGVDVPRTESYDPEKHTIYECVALDREACQRVRDGDTTGALADYCELSHLSKIISADLPVLRGGTVAPIHTHFEELLETGRTGSSAPNVQNIARGDKDRPGARECYVPRPLMWDALTGTLSKSVLIDSDYSLGELHTLAQACLWLLGSSKLAEALKAGKDPHSAMACEILGLTYAEGLKRKKDADFKNARNAGKGVNFGKPGGLGIETMRAYGIRSYGVDLPGRCDCFDRGACSCLTWEKILKLWEALWPEMPDYFAWVNAQQGKRRKRTKEGKLESLYNIRQLFSGRLRAGATYCSSCNTIFQGLLADVLKRAGWYLFKACYLHPSVMLAHGIGLSHERTLERSVLEQTAALYGCRPVNEIHDQFLIEAPEDRGNAAAVATAALMNRAGAEILPDVPVKCSPLLARRWSKNADEIRDGAGQLVAWEDSRLAGQG